MIYINKISSGEEKAGQPKLTGSSTALRNPFARLATIGGPATLRNSPRPALATQMGPIEGWELCFEELQPWGRYISASNPLRNTALCEAGQAHYSLSTANRLDDCFRIHEAKYRRLYAACKGVFTLFRLDSCVWKR